MVTTPGFSNIPVLSGTCSRSLLGWEGSHRAEPRAHGGLRILLLEYARRIGMQVRLVSNA